MLEMLENSERTALILEDDGDVCELLSMILNVSNLKVVQTDSVIAAEKLMEDIRPSIIFVDHGLPDGKGFNMIPKFRKKYPAATIVAMTGQRKEELRDLSQTEGRFHYMEKPFQFVELLKIIKTAV